MDFFYEIRSRPQEILSDPLAQRTPDFFLLQSVSAAILLSTRSSPHIFFANVYRSPRGLSQGPIKAILPLLTKIRT